VSESFSIDTKEQIRQAVDIVDLVGSYITLRRQGRGYVGICPWHDDTRPSLQINPERQTFKCWVCDIGGDIFTFIMKVEGVEFREAIELLAERAGIELKPTRQGSGSGSTIDKKKLFRAAAWTESVFHKFLLKSPEAEVARRYLADRGINDQSINRFQLGFAPNRSGFAVAEAQNDPERARVLEQLGVVIRRDDGSYYDRFAGRVLFSIRDAQDRPVGIGGRVLPESGNSSPAKYLNSPETPLFAKHKLLYGLSLAKDPIRHAGNVLVMEGYTDVIAAHQFGFENAVAVLGTALGEEHIKILRRFTEQVILVLDGDEAGRRRAGEVLELFVAQKGVDLKIVTLPAGADPCDFLQEHGAEAFADLLENRAVDALDHLFQIETEGIDLEIDIHAAGKAMERILSVLSKQKRPSGEDALREQQILNRLARNFRLPEEQLRDQLAHLRRQSKRVYSQPARSPQAATIDPNALLNEVADEQGDAVSVEGNLNIGSVKFSAEGEVIDPPAAKLAELHRTAPVECEVLELIIAHPELLPQAIGCFQWDRFANGSAAVLYKKCCRLFDAGTMPTFDKLMLEFDRDDYKRLLIELVESRRLNEMTDPTALMEELINRYQQNQLDRKRSSQIVALKDEGLEESQKTEMLQNMFDQLRNQHGIARPKEGSDTQSTDSDSIESEDDTVSFDPASFDPTSFDPEEFDSMGEEPDEKLSNDEPF
jgi:DNA primase